MVELQVTYDEFGERLRKIKAEFLKARGQELTTVSELERFLELRLAKRPRRAGARSLKGLF